MVRELHGSIRQDGPNLPEFLWPCNMKCACPVAIFQNWMLLSLEPETTH
jgi:hypothetical protein